MPEQAKKPSKLDELRAGHAWLDHLARAGMRYTERHGDHYAAAITYFSMLALVPLLMIAFAVAAFVLRANPALLVELKEAITAAAPGALSETLTDIVEEAIESGAAIGLIGLVGALYSGLGWMTNIREALSEQWGQRERPPAFARRLGVDLAALLGLGLALVVSFGLTVVGTTFAAEILGLFGLAGTGWAKAVLGALGAVLGIAANALVFLWVIAKLPREPVTWRSAAEAAVFAGIGFEIIKQVMIVYLATVSDSPAGAAFGPILGLLIFIFIVSRFLLFLTAWAATAPENDVSEPPPAPPPAVIRTEVAARTGPDGAMAAGLVGAGAVAGLLGGRWLSRSRR